MEYEGKKYYLSPPGLITPAKLYEEDLGFISLLALRESGEEWVQTKRQLTNKHPDGEEISEEEALLILFSARGPSEEEQETISGLPIVDMFEEHLKKKPWAPE